MVGWSMTERTATVEMDDQGRLYVPKAVRKSLGVLGERTMVEIDIELIED